MDRQVVLAHVFGWGPWHTGMLELEELIFWSGEAQKILETMNGRT